MKELYGDSAYLATQAYKAAAPSLSNFLKNTSGFNGMPSNLLKYMYPFFDTGGMTAA